MDMTDRQIRRLTEQRSVVIDEVNLANNHISMKDQFGTTLMCQVNFSEAVTVVPRPKETWLVERRGSDWFLKKKAIANTLFNLNPGDVLINGEIFTKSLQGIVNSDGTINTGTGFTVGHVTGTYTITYTTAFSDPPLLTLAKVDPAGYITISTNATASTVIKTYNTSATLTDSAFHFTATRIA